MDDPDPARDLQRGTAYDLEPIISDAPTVGAADPAEERLQRLIPLRLVTSGPRPEFCSYRSKRGKRCDELARWRERDGARGYCDRHRASVGLDDPTA
ncbi:MAG TPA: hypothetical protein VFW92_08855 [Candidatus Limnocylindrales bacterium]|jgi:hypothetical protein|nr:hypothetical protein [Candidatus Limnocylindrales bacterium]